MDATLEPRVLFIGHDPGLAPVLERLFRPWRVWWSSELAEGLAVLGQMDVDAVLVETSLDGCSPLEALRCLRDKSPSVPVIVLADQADQADVVEALGKEADDVVYVSRLTRHALVRRVRYAMGHRAILRAVEAFQRGIRDLQDAWRGGLSNRRSTGLFEAALARAHGVMSAVDALRCRDLQQALDRHEVALAAVAHDLRNPLSAIRARAQMLLNVAAQQPLEPRWAVEQMTQIDQKAAEMGRLIDDLLDISRAQFGSPSELARQCADLSEIVHTVVEQHSATIVGQPRILFEADGPLVGLWDVERLKRVASNLLENAVKYSPLGEEVSVRLTHEQDHGDLQAMLIIEDHGVGIPDSDRAEIFDWFHRGTNVVGSIPGTGLGLAVARQIVEQHGGEIWVDSEEGVGSRFVVRLPILAEPGRPGTHPLRRALKANKKRRESKSPEQEEPGGAPSRRRVTHPSRGVRG